MDGKVEGIMRTTPKSKTGTSPRGFSFMKRENTYNDNKSSKTDQSYTVSNPTSGELTKRKNEEYKNLVNVNDMKYNAPKKDNFASNSAKIDSSQIVKPGNKVDIKNQVGKYYNKAINNGNTYAQSSLLDKNSNNSNIMIAKESSRVMEPRKGYGDIRNSYQLRMAHK